MSRDASHDANPASPVLEASKFCHACVRTLPRSEFYRHNGKPDGLAARCKTCHKAASHAWRHDNRELERQIHRESKRKAAERRRGQPTAPSRTCNACGQHKPADEFHRDAKSASGLSRICKPCRAAWVRAHWDLFLNYAHERRTTGPRPDRQAIYQRDNGICYLCGRRADLHNWHLEHITPVHKGGTNHPNNLAVSHPHCNQTKHTRPPTKEQAARLRRSLVELGGYASECVAGPSQHAETAAYREFPQVHSL